MTRLAIIQARMSSTRFPGKVLEDLGGVPMIVFMARRVLDARRIDRLIVATSTDGSDDVLAQSLASHGIECFRGSLTDVLDRYYQAARQAKAEFVVRLTGDSPLIDADLVDAVMSNLECGNCDYACNCEPPTHPDGLWLEGFTMAALEKAWQHARRPAEREHVTTWLRDPANGARITNVSGFSDLSGLRWTVDYPRDLELVRELIEGVGREKFDRFDLYRQLEALRLSMRLAANTLRVRRATAADSARMYGWRNHPVTRAGSRNSKEISPREHAQWFESALADPKRLVLVGEVGPRPVGVIRFDQLDLADLQVSLYVDPNLHELGLGTALLRAGEAAAHAWLSPAHRFRAIVLPGNVKSRRLFKSAGYAFQGDTGQKS